jgi:hypothetical protein
MLLLAKLIKKFLKILNADVAPWQVFLGATFGILLGLLPFWPLVEGPSPLAMVVLLLALVINCHLGSVLVFWGIGGLLYLVLRAPADALAPSFEPLAATCADIGFLHASLWSHSGWLSLSLLGLILAPIIGALMAWSAHTFQTKYRGKLLERKKLVKAGKVAGNGIILRTTCWFFGI